MSKMKSKESVYAPANKEKTQKEIPLSLANQGKKLLSKASKAAAIERKLNIPAEIMNKCEMIIHGAAVAAGASGVAGVLLDSVLITPIQIGMVISLGKVFDQNIIKTDAKKILKDFTASLAGRSVSQIVVRWIPLIGNVINTTTASGMTELLGWMTVDYFYEQTESNVKSVEVKQVERSPVYQPPEKPLNTPKPATGTIQMRADAFFKGKKTYQSDREEFIALLNDIEAAALETSNAQLDELFQKLVELAF